MGAFSFDLNGPPALAAEQTVSVAGSLGRWGFALGLAYPCASARDFAFWGVHYAMHKTKIGWLLHAPHHRSERMYTLVASKGSWPGMFLTDFGPQMAQALIDVAILVPLLYGANLVFDWGMEVDSVILQAAFMTMFVALWQHSNADWQKVWRPFRALFMGPERHHQHHDIRPEMGFTNLGSTTPVADYVMGTLTSLDEAQITEEVGIEGTDIKDTYIDQAFGSFFRGLGTLLFGSSQADGGD